jgi:predicted dehydrogenase
MRADKHTLVLVNPGHFHAALTLRLPHPRLEEDVHVYAEDGPDLERFLAIVESFNARESNPTRWRLHVHRGEDHLQRLIAERPGRLAIVAGRNDAKMALIERLHAAGMAVLADKPWVIRSDQLDAVRRVCSAPPLAMDIMTERHEVSVRVMKALMQREEVMGSLRALSLESVHHLYKLVNGRPLVRPAWYFDVDAQGEGIGDVNTHLVDLVQWMTESDLSLDFARDVTLIAARQWPTGVPLDLFQRITGLAAFPETLTRRIDDGVLQYLCNASLRYRLRGVGVELETRWDLAIPEGGGDTHCFVARGTRAEIEVRLDASTGFRSGLTVRPHEPSASYSAALAAALASMQNRFPGVVARPGDGGFRLDIPDSLRSTHEEHFAVVLDEFIEHLDRQAWPPNVCPDLLTKYTLLQQARDQSHAAAA